MTAEVALNFAVALLIGAVVGFEREFHRRSEPDDPGVAGLRTFILVAIAGAAATWMGQRLDSPWIFPLMGGLATALIIAESMRSPPAAGRGSGVTTEMALVVVYLLGGLTILGDRGLAVSLAIATSAVLAYKQPLHQLVGRIDRDDLYAGIRLLLASFVVLPVLPDRAIDPWGVFNPYKTWLLVVLISGLSLLGYVASRWLGAHRGVTLTGLFGGLVSSTAVTLSFARQSRDSSSTSPVNALGTGILLAWAVMFARVVIEVAIVNPSLLRPLAVPLSAMGATCLAVAAVFYLRGRAPVEAAPMRLTNPFSLTSAVKFALFFVAVQGVVELCRRFVPPGGMYALAGLAGLTDVDAITLSMANYAKTAGAEGESIAARSIAIAAGANTLTKCVLVAALGNAALRSRIVIATLVILAACALTLVAWQ